MKARYIIKDPKGYVLERTDLGYWFSPDRKDAMHLSADEADIIINEIKSVELKKEKA